ncbi:MAG TPA: hypothetical protein VJN02_08450 [Gammaproteobacteria bacterium]|nr:hypothetical protein [Gammaproteobacteria bacterium]
MKILPHKRRASENHIGWNEHQNFVTNENKCMDLLRDKTLSGEINTV